ncbi:hypothetical protein VFPFJ_04855 [Purpureocillium lilacinum]|uniref:Uncharacterized protein n=1 Tax=Purpureocillium lilacinum TaxID=33203 RepID=A0A179HJR1_PURLI|nr:hypothetical protein VFPFJ_04855 [Purpureocillium lilacinum]OAQ83913.1 hypothetical protein VFPBJ_02680 [Purpureocillium lilacinum]OAQ90696.1 hypothetical protein VFPFJ_04855 [Purpureocillium lilacinum]
MSMPVVQSVRPSGPFRTSSGILGADYDYTSTALGAFAGARTVNRTCHILAV